MSDPVVAEKSPAVLDLEAGTYYWCRCGKSQNQPYCDGSHQADGVFEPMELTLDAPKKVALCRCKKTGNEPFCDGTHKKL